MPNTPAAKSLSPLLHTKNTKPIRVVIADDSAFVRKAMTLLLEEDPQIKVVGVARNGKECLELVESLHPDVLTLDLNMPLMDGLSVLRIMHHEFPLPVIMISSLTVEGAEATLDALDLGAVDFIGKDLTPKSLDIDLFQTELISKVKWAAQQKSVVQRSISPPVPGGEVKGGQNRRDDILQGGDTLQNGNITPARVEVVAIGASTGGPIALQQIIPLLPRDFPVPVIVAQHIPKQFSLSLANRLDKKSRLTVKEAEPGDKLNAGMVFIAPGGKHTQVDSDWRIELIANENGGAPVPCPSVNRLFSSLAMNYQKGVLGVVLTGMGDDGVDGARRIRELGGQVLVQDEATSVAYSMPRMVKEQGLANREAPLDLIAAEILRML
jgi:two-component system chemotaxis response regulator CheB